MKRVLFVDSFAPFRAFISSFFNSKNNIVVDTAITTLTALSMAKQQHYDLFVIDYGALYRKNFFFLDQKKHDRALAPIPTILTALSISPREKLSFFHGDYNISDILIKPLRINRFIGTIEKTLDIKIDVDSSESVADVSLNDGIVIVDIKKGLNIDKLSVLIYKLKEILFFQQISDPLILANFEDVHIKDSNIASLVPFLTLLLEEAKLPQSLMVVAKKSNIIDYIRSHPALNMLSVSQDYDFAINELLEAEKEEKEEKGDPPFRRKLVRNNFISSLDLNFETEKPITAEEWFKENIIKARVCIVDDDPTVQTLIEETYSKIGWQCDKYSDGSDFLKVASQINYDLIILDLTMERVDGLTVLQRLKKANYKTPIIVLSAHSRQLQVREALKHGIRKYLLKPATPAMLLDKTLDIFRASV